jgi:hypothetical protein
VSALTVLVIRHGEKPDPDHPDDPPGLTPDGKKDNHSLLIRGWQRAGAWAALFGSRTGRADFPEPSIVYAANPDQQTGPHGKRALQTVLPLSERLHITPITKFGVGQESDLAKEVQALTGVVLISWEHKLIVEGILPQLTEGQTIPQLPTKWSGARFDVVLRLDRVQAGAQWSFRQLFPRLLVGDLDIPVSQAS